MHIDKNIGVQIIQYLVANGYAVMDLNGLPFEYANKNGIDIHNNIDSPIVIRSYVKAYHYCMDHFNLKPGVFCSSGSMMTFTVMIGSFIATASNKVLEITGGYTTTFIMLLAFTFVALILNLFIKKP